MGGLGLGSARLNNSDTQHTGHLGQIRYRPSASTIQGSSQNLVRPLLDRSAYSPAEPVPSSGPQLAFAVKQGHGWPRMSPFGILILMRLPLTANGMLLAGGPNRGSHHNCQPLASRRRTPTDAEPGLEPGPRPEAQNVPRASACALTFSRLLARGRAQQRAPWCAARVQHALVRRWTTLALALRAHACSLLKLPAAKLPDSLDGLEPPLGNLLAGGPSRLLR